MAGWGRGTLMINHRFPFHVWCFCSFCFECGVIVFVKFIVRCHYMFEYGPPSSSRPRVAQPLTRSASPPSTASTRFSMMMRKIYSTLAGHRRDVEVTKGTQWGKKDTKNSRTNRNQMPCMHSNLMRSSQADGIQDTHSQNKCERVLFVLHKLLQSYTSGSIKCLFQIMYLRLRVLWGWKLVCVWFSCFPVAFKWARWIWPSTRTAYPQSLTEPVSSDILALIWGLLFFVLGWLCLLMRFSTLQKQDKEMRNALFVMYSLFRRRCCTLGSYNDVIWLFFTLSFKLLKSKVVKLQGDGNLVLILFSDPILFSLFRSVSHG